MNGAPVERSGRRQPSRTDEKEWQCAEEPPEGFS
jgi:hypothetical protein